MTIRKQYWAALILASATVLLAFSCKKKSPDEARDTVEPSVQTPTAEKVNDTTDTTKSSKDGGVVMTEDEMDRAQKRAEAFMQKHGPEIIGRLANQQVRFFRTNLERGDALYKEKKYKDAILAYRDSLATKPNDARTLLRIATSALAGGDLATARATCLLGLNRAYDPRVRAGILSALGDIALKRREDKEALHYYSSAQRATPSPDIEKKIKQLEKTVKQPLPSGQESIGGKLAPVGPAKDLAGLCQELSLYVPKDTRGIKCDPSAAKTITAPDGPFREAAYLPAISAETEQHYVLAGKTDAGWFALAELAQVSQIVSLYSVGDKFQVTQFEFKQLIPGGPHELIIAFTHGLEDSDPGINEVEKRVSSTLLICGQKGETLECMKRIPTLLNRERTVLAEAAETAVKPGEHLGSLPIKESFVLTADTSKPGKVVVRSKGKGPLDQKFKPLIGTFAL